MPIETAVPRPSSNLHRSRSTSLNSASNVVAALFDQVDYIGAAFGVEIRKWLLQHRVLGGTVLSQWCLVGRRCLLLECFEVWL